jgi:hypothetical protein
MNTTVRRTRGLLLDGHLLCMDDIQGTFPGCYSGNVVDFYSVGVVDYSICSVLTRLLHSFKKISWLPPRLNNERLKLRNSLSDEGDYSQ